jgi:hypothetical protein
MIRIDRMASIAYGLCIMMLARGRHHYCWLAPAGLVAAILAIVLPLCLVGGTLASQDSCQDLGSPPGLCSKAASHADHLVAVPALLILPGSTQQVSIPVAISLEPAFPSFGHLSIPEGRAPPLS